MQYVIKIFLSQKSKQKGCKFQYIVLPNSYIEREQSSSHSARSLIKVHMCLLYSDVYDFRVRVHLKYSGSMLGFPQLLGLSPHICCSNTLFVYNSE